MMVSVSLLVAVGVAGAVGVVVVSNIAKEAEANCLKSCVLEEMHAA